MPRNEFSTRTKREARERATGEDGIIRCEECTVVLRDGGFHYDHIVPDGLGGKPTLENCSVCCKTCHKIKTTTQDIPQIAKMKRQRDKAAGIRKPKHKWPKRRVGQ